MKKEIQLAYQILLKNMVLNGATRKEIVKCFAEINKLANPVTSRQDLAIFEKYERELEEQKKKLEEKNQNDR
jgi:hypothetical protein